MNTLQLKQAENFFEHDDAGKGVAYLARMLRQNPSNQIAASRLMSALTDRSFALPVRVFEHTENLRDAEFSPDGRSIVTCGGDDTNGVARIWNAHTGELIGKPMRHDGFVNKVQFSPDGRFLATASRDASARIWDATTGEPVTGPLTRQRSSGGKPQEVGEVEFSPDGQTLVTGSGSKAQLWKVATGEALNLPLDHGAELYTAKFSPDSRWVVTTGWNSLVRIWDAGTGKLLLNIINEKSSDAIARLSPDGSRLVTSTADNHIQLWDANTGRKLLELPDGVGGTVSIRFSPDGLRIVGASPNRFARVWDAQTGQPLIPQIVHKLAVWDALFDRPESGSSLAKSGAHVSGIRGPASR